MSAIAGSVTEVYRDPIYDGATDPTVVVTDDGLRMFYTQRRATHPTPGPGVSWVHGSRIGVAVSTDGETWTYAGTLEPHAAPDGRGALRLDAAGPPNAVDVTHWAPDVIHDGSRWRMYLTEIDGIPDRWPGHRRTIVEYVSDDLASWDRVGPLTLASDRVIDAAVARCPDGRWRLWYKDEAADSVTMVASTDDLDAGAWRLDGVAIGGRPHEGPFVFPLGGRWWMLTDEWRGMAVYGSDDAVHWMRQIVGDGDDGVILDRVDGATGPANHGSVTMHGGAAWLYCFMQPESAPGARTHPATPDEETIDDRRCAVIRVRLEVIDGALVAVS